MHVMELMDGVDSQHHLADVEPCHVFRELVFKFTEQSQQIATHVVIHDEVLHREGKGREHQVQHPKAGRPPRGSSDAPSLGGRLPPSRVVQDRPSEHKPRRLRARL